MSDPGLTIDQRGLRTTGGRLRTYLPDDLVARYEPLHNLNVSAGQADLVVARDRVSGEEVVVKLYRNAEQLDREVMERLYGADTSHVVRLIEHGETDGEPWEVQEYCSLGTLTDYRLEQGGHLSESQALAAVKELADAIHHIHGLHITHRDLKPENILVRELEPLDLVLTDFGVAAEQIATVQLQTVAASWVWAAPEVHTKGAVSRDIDWWAMGAIVHQLLTGRHPLSGRDGRLPSDLKVIRAGVVDGLYSTDAVGNERWRNLVDGLLSYEPTQRWGYEQVSAWLIGQNPEVVRTMPVAQQLLAAKHAIPEETREHLFVWNGAAIRTGLELVQAMRAEWPTASKFLDRWPDRSLRDWLLTRPDGQVIAQVMDREANGDGRLIRLQARFDPDGPLEFMGRAVNDESINWAIKAVEHWSPESGGEAGEAHTWLAAIRDRHVLTAIAAAVESDSQRLIRADQLLSDWKEDALGFAAAVRKNLSSEQSNQASAAAETEFKRLLGIQFAAALGGDVPGEHSDRSRQLASRIRATLDALGEHELLPKSSPWASKQRARDTILGLAAQVSSSNAEDLGLHIPASIYLDLMIQVCSHDLAELRSQAERMKRERDERERAEREARARVEREARERAEREARARKAQAERERADAQQWWDRTIANEERKRQEAAQRSLQWSIESREKALAQLEAKHGHSRSSGDHVDWGAPGAFLFATLFMAPLGGFMLSVMFGLPDSWMGPLILILGGIGLLFVAGSVVENLAGDTRSRRARREQAQAIAREKAEIERRNPIKPLEHVRLIRVPAERAGAVIGKGGATIKGLQQRFNATIVLEDWHAGVRFGRTYAFNSSFDTRRTTKDFSRDAPASARGQRIHVACVTAISAPAAESAVEAIRQAIAASARIDEARDASGPVTSAITIGQVFSGPIKRIAEFGAFVELAPGVDGLLHISAMKVLNSNRRVEQVGDVVRIGQVVRVRIAEVKPGNKYSLELVR